MFPCFVEISYSYTGAAHWLSLTMSACLQGTTMLNTCRSMRPFTASRSRPSQRAMPSSIQCKAISTLAACASDQAISSLCEQVQCCSLQYMDKPEVSRRGAMLAAASVALALADALQPSSAVAVSATRLTAGAFRHSVCDHYHPDLAPLWLCATLHREA